MNASHRALYARSGFTCNRKSKESGTKKRLSHVTKLLPVAMASLMFALPARAADIMVTLPPLAGLVQMLQPNAPVACLLPANADPHHFQLTPQQIEALHNARLLIRASRDDGGWPQLPTRGTTVDLWPQTDHAWLSPVQVRAILPALATQLETIADAATAEQIRNRLPQALKETTEIDAAWRTLLTQLQTRGAIVQHPAWQHLLGANGVEVYAVLEPHQHGREGGPHLLDHALAALKAHPDALLLGDTRHSNRSLEWLARQSGKSIIYLDALGKCGDSWQTLMQQNLARLRAVRP